MKKDKIISFRVPSDDYKEIKRQKKILKFKSVGEMFMHLWDRFRREREV